MRKWFNCLVALFVISLMTLSTVKAINSVTTNFDSLNINGNEISLTKDPVTGQVSLTDPNFAISVDEGESLNIKLGIKSTVEVEDIEVDAKIGGYEYSDYEELSDNTHLFDVRANNIRYAKLSIEVPRDLGEESPYLRLRILDSNTEAITFDIPLSVYSARHGVDISDIVFSEGNTIKAGRSLLTIVQLENYGSRSEEDVKVTIEIPQLGVSATEFVDLESGIGAGDRYNTEEMYLGIPADAATGDYEVKVTAKFDRKEAVTQTAKVHIVANEQFQTAQAAKAGADKLILAVGPESQTVSAGKSGVYAIALTNAGAASKAYLLEAVTGNWATAKLSESLVVLEPGKNKVVYVEITPAADAAVGEHAASIAIKSGSDVLETITLKANVVVPQPEKIDGTSFNLRNGLEIALIILVVLLVIVGLIVGFSRLKKDNGEEDQTYY